MAPVLRALHTRGVETLLMCTGQHPLLDLTGCGVSQAPDVVLDFDPLALTAEAMCKVMAGLAAEALDRISPDLVLVQGDTNSALAGACAARMCGVPIGHVEAGLRTFDAADPWPEERNRVKIDELSELLFAPTARACANLRAEGVGGAVFLSGNSGIDALFDTARAISGDSPRADPPLVLVTVHRRENRGANMARIAEALRLIAAQEAVEFAVPLHPNPTARAAMVAAVTGVAGVRLLEPQNYCEMVGLMLRSRLILTDSGGMQEEAPALGRPLLVLRASTERPEAIASGNNLLVGTDPRSIADEALRLLRDEQAHARMSIAAFPFGSGGASTLIAEQIAVYLGSRAPPGRRRGLTPQRPPPNRIGYAQHVRGPFV